MPSSKLMDKGLIVIPKEIREAMGVKKGDRIGFVKWGKEIFIGRLSGDPIEALYGSLPSKGSMADFLEEKRRELEEEEKDLPPPVSQPVRARTSRKPARIK